MDEHPIKPAIRLAIADERYAASDIGGALRIYDEVGAELEEILIASEERSAALIELLARARAGSGLCNEHLRRFGEAIGAWSDALELYESLGAQDTAPARTLRRILGTYRQYPIAFISYSTADQDFASRLDRSLRRRGCTVIRDVHSFRNGGPIVDEIDQAMQVSPNHIVLWSATYATRLWTTYELQRARGYLDASGARGRRVIIVRLDETPMPDGWTEVLWLDALERDLRPIFSSIWRTLTCESAT